MSAAPEHLLEELVERWARGEPLEVEELLGRAGPRSLELAALIDAFLERAPRREPSEDALAFVRSLERPSLLTARQARRLKLDDLAAALAERLALPLGARAKLRRHYQSLELGQLDPAGVSRSVWEALTGLLGSDARALAALPPAAQPAAVMFRSASREHEELLAAPAEAAAKRAEPDEVDRLFGVTAG